MSDIHKHSIGLLNKAIKTVLGFKVFEISNLLFTCITTFLAVMLKLTRILVIMDLEPLYVIREKMTLI